MCVYLTQIFFIPWRQEATSSVVTLGSGWLICRTLSPNVEVWVRMVPIDFVWSPLKSLVLAVGRGSPLAVQGMLFMKQDTRNQIGSHCLSLSSPHACWMLFSMSCCDKNTPNLCKMAGRHSPHCDFVWLWGKVSSCVCLRQAELKRRIY